MKKKAVFLIFAAVLVMLLASIASVSAQDIDVENLDNEQLTTLLLQILNKLQQEEEPAAAADPAGTAPESPDPIETPVPAADPDTIEEIIQITIYDNKKLIIEALPEYMFIQPTEPPKPEKPEPNSNKKKDTTTTTTTTDEHGCKPGEVYICTVIDGCFCRGGQG